MKFCEQKFPLEITWWGRQGEMKRNLAFYHNEKIFISDMLPQSVVAIHVDRNSWRSGLCWICAEDSSELGITAPKWSEHHEFGNNKLANRVLHDPHTVKSSYSSLVRIREIPEFCDYSKCSMYGMYACSGFWPLHTDSSSSYLNSWIVEFVWDKWLWCCLFYLKFWQFEREATFILLVWQGIGETLSYVNVGRLTSFSSSSVNVAVSVWAW